MCLNAISPCCPFGRCPLKLVIKSIKKRERLGGPHFLAFQISQIAIARRSQPISEILEVRQVFQNSRKNLSLTFGEEYDAIALRF